MYSKYVFKIIMHKVSCYKITVYDHINEYPCKGPLFVLGLSFLTATLWFHLFLGALNDFGIIIL